MKKLLVYLKDYKKESILGPLFKLLEASFELLVPLVMAKIIDVGIVQKDKQYIIQMCAVLILLGIVGLLCSITAQYFAAKAAVGFSAKLRMALFSHMQSLSFTEIDHLGTATMITRMTSDINQLQNGVNMVLRLFLRSPFIVLGAMIMAYTIDTKAALVFVAVIPLLSIVVFGIMAITIPLYKKVQTALDKVLSVTRENLTGVRVIRAFGKEESEAKAFEETNNILMKSQNFVGRISALMNPVTYIIINGGLLVLIWTGAWRVEAGIITQGAVVALVNYMSQILIELIKLANLIITLTKAFACGNRIQDIFEIKSSILEKKKNGDEGELNSKMAVSFKDVSLQYFGASEEALTAINFSVKRGQTIGIIGGTGSGKSSLVHLIPRFYDAAGGSVYVDGRDVREYSLEKLRSKIGIVMQKSVLFSGTIRENLYWGNENASDDELWEALTISQAKEFVEKKREGLDTRISQGGKNLSGGQKQRLAIARALVKKPEILILDDSASALDFATDAALRSGLREMEGDMTVFIVSQRASSVLHADCILVLDDGNIVGMGTHDNLIACCEVYQEIYYSQFEKKEGC